MAKAAARRHNWKRVLGTALAALAALLVIALIVVAVRADAWANDYANDLEAEWSRKLGRDVRIGDVDVSLWGGKVEVAGLEIGTGEDEPRAAPQALTLERAALNVGVLRTLLSAGSRPYVESVSLRTLRVNVVRLPDGTLNWQRISERLERESPRDEARRGPDERVRKTVIELGRLEQGEIAFTDLARRRGANETQPDARISAIDLRIDDAGYERGMQLSMMAAVLANDRNLTLRATTSGVRERDGRTAPPAIRELNLHMAPTELSPLAPYLAALSDGSGSALSQGVLGADFALEGEDGTSKAGGKVSLTSARFGRGEQFDAWLDLDMAIDSDAGRVDVQQADLHAGDMRLLASFALTGLGEVPQLQDARVRSTGLSFDRIRALYPAFDRRTEPATLRGPFALTATGGGSRGAQHVELALDLTRASVQVPERFHKPAGIPLRLDAELDTSDDVMDIRAIALQLAEFRMVGRGQVSELQSDAPRFRIAFDTPSPEAGSLLRMLPEVARATGARGDVPGRLAIEGTLEGTSERFDAEAELALSGLDVRADEARFQGGGQATFTMRKEAERWNAEASADFTQLRAVYPGLFHKPEPTPFTFAASLSGEAGRPETFQATVPRFVFAAGRSDVRGSLELENLNDPQIAVRARSRYLDPDDFLPAGGGREREGARESEPSRLARADGTVDLNIAAGRARDIEFRDLVAKLRLRDGRARAETLRVSTFGGRFSGAGSELPLFGRKGPLRVRATLEGMQAQQLLARLAGAPNLLRGTVAGTVDVTASGADLRAFRNTLTGRMSGRVEQARFVPGSGYSALAERLQALSSVPGLSQTIARASERLPGENGGGWQLAELAGVLRFDDGAVLIDEPLTAQTPQGALSLDGRVSLGGAGRLTGTWAVEPEAISALIGTQLEVAQPIPIELRIEGPLTQPRFAFGDMQPMVQQMVQAYARTHLEGRAREQIERALDGSPLDQLPFGRGREQRGAKQPQEDGDAQEQEPQQQDRDQEQEQRERPEDKTRRELEERLPDLF